MNQENKQYKKKHLEPSLREDLVSLSQGSSDSSMSLSQESPERMRIQENMQNRNSNQSYWGTGQRHKPSMELERKLQ